MLEIAAIAILDDHLSPVQKASISWRSPSRKDELGRGIAVATALTAILASDLVRIGSPR